MAVRRFRAAVAGEATAGRARADFLLADGLAGYVQAVAQALQVSVEATNSEVSDTATAYLALTTRSPSYPDRDLMLVWSERCGWALAVETAPTEAPTVLAYLGADPAPRPEVVVRFVGAVLAGVFLARTPPEVEVGRPGIGARLAGYLTAWH